VETFLEIMGEILIYFRDTLRRRLLVSLASLYADPGLVRYASEKGYLFWHWAMS
jgi:hypothetical protein